MHLVRTMLAAVCALGAGAAAAADNFPGPVLCSAGLGSPRLPQPLLAPRPACLSAAECPAGDQIVRYRHRRQMLVAAVEPLRSSLVPFDLVPLQDVAAHRMDRSG